MNFIIAMINRLAILLSALCVTRLVAATEFVDSQERPRLVKILTDALRRRDFVSVHAGDALITLGLAEPAIKAFEPQQDSTEPKYRIGVWRVLAQFEADKTRRARHAARIREVLLDERASDRVHALEALAKLGEPILDEPERRAVDHFTKDAAAAPFACWRLAQAGQSSAIDQLVASLRGNDVVGRTRAAYVLARLPSSRNATRSALIAALSAEPAETTAHLAIVCALDGEPLRALAQNGSTPAVRYSAAMELARCGDARADGGLLRKLLKDDDEDVRVAAAFALLEIDARAEMKDPPSDVTK